MSPSQSWGEPPLPEIVVRLLRERWSSLSSSDDVVVRVDEAALELQFELVSGTSRFLIRLSPEEPNRLSDGWDTLLDALDALVGQFEESGRNHRSLPSGKGIAFREAKLNVDVQRNVPELERLASQILGASGVDKP